MKPWYAINARQLLETRRSGVTPADPVSVVLTGNTEPAPALYVRDDMPLERMDWRMLVNLEVWLWASPAVPLERVILVARAIAAVRPSRLVLRFDAGSMVHDIDIGSGYHQPGLEAIGAALSHEFWWNPLNLCWTEIGKRLQRALLLELPRWSVL